MQKPVDEKINLMFTFFDEKATVAIVQLKTSENQQLSRTEIFLIALYCISTCGLESFPASTTKSIYRNIRDWARKAKIISLYLTTTTLAGEVDRHGNFHCSCPSMRVAEQSRQKQSLSSLLQRSHENVGIVPTGREND